MTAAGINVQPTVRQLRSGMWEAFIELPEIGRLEGRGSTAAAAMSDLGDQLDALERFIRADDEPAA